MQGGKDRDGPGSPYHHNLGGSREALTNSMDNKAQVVLVQEHRLAEAGQVGMQAATMAKGWHGV